jgi:hypothetical protein
MFHQIKFSFAMTCAEHKSASLHSLLSLALIFVVVFTRGTKISTSIPQQQSDFMRRMAGTHHFLIAVINLGCVWSGKIVEKTEGSWEEGETMFLISHWLNQTWGWISALHKCWLKSAVEKRKKRLQDVSMHKVYINLQFFVMAFFHEFIFFHISSLLIFR